MVPDRHVGEQACQRDDHGDGHRCGDREQDEASHSETSAWGPGGLPDVARPACAPLQIERRRIHGRCLPAAGHLAVPASGERYRLPRSEWVTRLLRGTWTTWPTA